MNENKNPLEVLVLHVKNKPTMIGLTWKQSLQEWSRWYGELVVKTQALQQQLESYRSSKVKCIEWLLKYTLLDPNDAMLLTQSQAVLRTFIEKELLGGK